MGHTGQLPDRVLRLIDPADRKPLGKAGLTHDEAQQKAAVRLERELHEQFTNWLKLHRLPYIHAAMCKKSTIRAGWPDFTVVYGRGVCCVEFKAPGGVVSPDQREVISGLLALGTPVLVTESAAEAIAFTKREVHLS